MLFERFQIVHSVPPILVFVFVSCSQISTSLVDFILLRVNVYMPVTSILHITVNFSLTLVGSQFTTMVLLMIRQLVVSGVVSSQNVGELMLRVSGM